MAAPSTFSYAQAAKGQAASSVSLASAATTASSTNPPTSQTAENKGAQVAPNPETSQHHPGLAGAGSLNGAEDGLAAGPKRDYDGSLNGGHATKSGSASASVADSHEYSVQDPTTRKVDASVASGPALDAVTDDVDGKKTQRKWRRGKPGEKEKGEQESTNDKEPDQEKEQPVKVVELSEAPLPAVNIWEQRREAQAAKSKQSLTSGHTTASDAPAPVPGINDATSRVPEYRKKTKMVETSDSQSPSQTNGSFHNGGRPTRKVTDSGRFEVESGPRRNGPRGFRAPDKEGHVGTNGTMPSVEDVASWPTPESAIKEDRRKTSDKQDKMEGEAAQDDASTSKIRPKEKWERMDFVPTVQFATPLPPTRNTRGGRGGGRGGRDVGSRGGHSTHASSTAGASAEKPVISGQPGPKPGSEARERSRDGPVPARANSLPPSATKRTSIDGSAAREQRKPSAPAVGDRHKDFVPVGRPSDNSGGPRDRTDARPGQGRGGSAFRGRGGPSAGTLPPSAQPAPFVANGTTYGSQANPTSRQQPYSPPLRQGPFAAGFGGQSTRQTGRSTGRAQSTSAASSHSRMNGIGGNGGRVAPIQTGLPSYDYPMQPMTAVPFQSTYYFDPLLTATLKSQLEYYFSIDNLCKDMFLRKHMDDQGFVYIAVIASFRRVQELTTDMEMLRAACQDSDQLDFVVGNDNNERVRSKQHWKMFLLPWDQREEHARTAGPAMVFFRSRNPPAAQPYLNGMVPGEYGAPPPPMYGMDAGNNGYQQSYPGDKMGGHAVSPGYNGNAQGMDKQLSASVPSFSPSHSGDIQSNFGSQYLQEPTNGAPLHNESSQDNASPQHNGATLVSSLSREELNLSPTANGSPNGPRLSDPVPSATDAARS